MDSGLLVMEVSLSRKKVRASGLCVYGCLRSSAYVVRFDHVLAIVNPFFLSDYACDRPGPGPLDVCGISSDWTRLCHPRESPFVSCILLVPVTCANCHLTACDPRRRRETACCTCPPLRRFYTLHLWDHHRVAPRPPTLSSSSRHPPFPCHRIDCPLSHSHAYLVHSADCLGLESAHLSLPLQIAC